MELSGRAPSRTPDGGSQQCKTAVWTNTVRRMRRRTYMYDGEVEPLDELTVISI